MKLLAFAPALAALVLAGSASAGPLDCDKLAGFRMAAAAIGLPTRGAAAVSAKMATSGTYCLVAGKILSRDPAAQDIHFQIALPVAWNGKAVMLGGGGFNGVIPDVSANLHTTPTDAPTPLARGYAVFASDSGHQAPVSTVAPPFDPDAGAFLRNDEQYLNYIGDALKKTHDVAAALIAAGEGIRPRRVYFLGGSKGGTEALILAARWPADWDGVLALYPGRSFTLALLGQLSVTQAMAAPGAYLTMAKRRALHEAALGACDALDGAKDGVISNVAGCHAIFDPATAMLDGAPLRCAGGGDAGEHCLSDRQIAALHKADGGVRFGFPIVGAEKVFLGFNILTADLGNSNDSPFGASFAARTIGVTAPTFPPSQGNSASAYFSDRFLRSAVTGDNRFDQLTLDIAHPPRPMAARLSELVALDQVGVDLTAFHQRRGKLIIIQGTDDMLSSPRQIESYYRQMQHAMGAANVARFVRFYEVPGFGHGGGTVFDASMDPFAAIENWVERGIDPADTLVVTDMAGVPGRTRPLCPFPTWPKYRGSGSVDVARSFRCAIH